MPTPVDEPPMSQETGRNAHWRPHRLDLLLAGLPLAILAVLLHWNDATLFFTSGAAIIPLARYIGIATEELSSQMGPAAGGLLNATFGNAPELIIAFFALRAGLTEVVKASLVGSILGNVLAVLGMSFLLGGWRRDHQHFNSTAAQANGAQLALAAGALLIPAVLAATTPLKSGEIEHLSVPVAVVLLAAYAAGLEFSLRTHAHLFLAAQERRSEEAWPIQRSLAMLLVATLAVAYLSDLLVEGVKGVTSGLGWSPVFVGVILVALLGNAAEHASAVSAARRDDMDLALSIGLGSAIQIALFVAPVLVLAGALVGHPMDLLFNTFEVASLGVGVALVNLVISDGESTWLEGVQLCAVYAILAAAFFLYP